MAEPTLTDVFGAGATQDATTLTIAKADLNITPSATNTAESLFTALFLNAQQALNSTAQGTDSDIQVTMDKESASPITRSNANYIRHVYTTRFDVPDQTETLNPNNF